jgi:Rad3-related DNA helicase
MTYEQQILEAYDRLGFKPRDRQVEHINSILVAFLDEKYTNVILSAPTGTGKSIIGAVVADVVHQIRMPNNKPGASFMLTATNVLAKQYQDSFGDPDDPWEGTFLQIKGASNYRCEALDTPDEPARADGCSIIAFQKAGMNDVIDKYCNRCEYKLSRAMREKCRHLITNYSYYFINRMYATHPMESRSVCVFDEAHLLNDLFVEHNAIYFSEKRLNAFAEEISEELGVGNHDIYRTFKQIKDALVAGRIRDDNYPEYLQHLLDVYRSVSDSLKAKAESSMRNPSKYVKLSRLSKKYYDLGCKIDDLFIFGYPAVFEYKAKDIKKGNNEHEVSVKPIFIGEMFEALHNAQHNLLMSATISESYVKRTMTLPGTTKYIRLPPQFPVENKKVVFFKPQLLNYNTMKDPAVVKRLTDTAVEIVRHHTALGERGVILAPSFIVGQAMAQALEKARIKGLQVFEHQRGEKLAEVLFDFKRAPGNAVLITPSGFEGIDLPGDQSRYQVVVKAPFGSLGDRRIEHIMNVYPDIYSLMALMKIVQGAGRSVRSMDDHATTYMLDTAIQRLWSKGNDWADEFKTRFTSSLEEEV